MILRALLLAALALAPAWGEAARAQAPSPSMPELRRLIDQRERNIERAETRRAVLEARADSLQRAKGRTAAGSAAFQTVSNQILQLSADIRQVQRDLRTYYGEVRSLRQELFVAVNRAITETTARIEELRRQGLTREGNPEVRVLLDRLRALVEEREALARALEEAEEDLYLPDLVFDPTDSPRDLRAKEAIARDAVARIDARIEALAARIEEERRKARMEREIDRLRDDIALWGDENAARSSDEIAQILERRGESQGRAGGANPFAPSTEETIRSLQARRIQLLERRSEFEALADQFAQRIREFYRN